jgi:pyruvate/2-oxoglutarate/acetoin dehydrogenase E1 component
MTIAEALREGIREEMRRDPTVFCLGEDIGVPGGFGGAFTVTLGLSGTSAFWIRRSPRPASPASPSARQ